MKLINNRYKIEGFSSKDSFDNYIVKDSLDKNKIKCMKIIDGNKNSELIDFYMREFIWLKSIKHKGLLNLEAFGRVETINLKTTNLPLYYLISDINPETTLNSIKEDLNLVDIIKITQELMSIVDYLHFRGISYKYLNPRKIYYSRKDGLKLSSLNKTIEIDYTETMELLNVDFFAPSIMRRNNRFDIKADYYSLNMIMRYLLLDKYREEGSFIFKDKFKLKKSDKNLLTEVIISLENAYKNYENISLLEIIQRLNELSDEEFLHDLKKEREHLFFKTKIVGREKELAAIRQIHDKVINNSIDFNGLMVKGISGVGKTRLIKEVAFRLKIKGSQVFRIDIDQSLSYDLHILNIFLNILTDNADINLIERYKDSFIKFIPEKYNYEKSYVNEDNAIRVDLYKLFNSICNYLKDMAFDKPVYIIIDNLDRYNDIFHNLIDYLLQTIFNSKIFIIFTINKLDEKRLFNMDKKWKNENLVQEMLIENLSQEDLAILTQNILGMSFAPVKFSSVLYDVSKGNPRFLDIILKEIFNKKELYISINGLWRSEKDNYSDLSLPKDFKTTIIEQTKDISGDKLEVLKLISISNESMSKYVIYNMLDFDIKYLSQIINSLLNEQILVETSYDNTYYYDFLSNDLKVTVYLDIDIEERKRLHNNFAELLHEYRPKIFRDLVLEISFHLVQADKKTMAADIIVDEASKIENIYADKAISFWEMAFSIIKNIDYPKKITILEKLTRINLHMTNIEKSEFYLGEFLKEAEKLGDLNYIIEAKNYYAELYLRNNEVGKLNTVIEDISRLSSTNNYLEGRILYYSLIIGSLIKGSNTDTTEIESMLDKAISLSKVNNISKYLGKLYFQYGLFYDINGQPKKSIEYYEKSLKYSEENKDIYDNIKAINNIGYVYLEGLGDREKCFKFFKEGLRKASKYGFSHLESIFLLNIGEVYLNILDCERALDYTVKAYRLGQVNKDNSVLIASHCNLGRIYLLTNQYDKAYEVYTYLINIHRENLITDSDVVLAYRNYLAEFYFNFGEYELAIKYTNLVKEMAEEVSLNYYFKSLFRMIHIDYMKGQLSNHEVFTILEKYRREDISQVYNCNLFILVSMTISKSDLKFGKELMKYYDKAPRSKESKLISEIGQILSLYLNRENDGLKELEEKISEIENRKDYNIDLQLYLQLANVYDEIGDYKKSMGYYIKAFDGIYKYVDSIKEFQLKLSFIEKFGVQGVKNSIYSLLKRHYGMHISDIDIRDIKESNFHDYFDLTPLIDSLTKKEISDIVSYKDRTGIESLEELISGLGKNYLDNIKLILNYIGKDTLAQRGFIITYNEKTNALRPLVSLIKGDNKIPDDRILFQSLKNKYGVLYNFSIRGFKESKLSSYLPKKTRGVICIPIFSSSKGSIGLDYSFYNRKKDLYGYIYLETDNALHRMDMERSKLVYSLAKLIALNLENEKLRKNSTIDKLTGIYNREHFEFQFETILEESRNNGNNFCLLMIDIDSFKSFNDRYGHLKGDEVLALVAQWIRKTVDSQGIVGRYGGEEFIIILEDCNLEEASRIGRLIKDKVEHSHIPGIEENVTISIGIAQYPDHGSYQIELTNNADQALYYAKEILSRNSLVIWDKDMKGSKKSVDKTKGLITSDPTETNRNILQMMDISESIKTDNDIEEKIYQLLGTIITISNCEYATLIQYNNEICKYYTRKRQTTNWITDEVSNIKKNLVDKVKTNKMGIFTIGWDEEIKDDFNLPNWDSILITPLIKEDIVKAIIYITVPLREREFNQETLNVINVLSNIFSGNY